MKKWYKCRYCNISLIRKWNLKVHIHRKHANMRNYLDNASNGTSNFYRESQNNTTNHLFSDSFERLIKYNPVVWGQMSLYREIVEKIEQVNDDAIFCILMHIMHLIDKRSRIQRYRQSL